MVRRMAIICCLYPLLVSAQTSLNTRLVGHLTFGKFSNDVWGYVDDAGNDYAIIGHMDGVSFVRVTDNDNLQLVAFIAGENSTWRDIKTYGHYAYVTNERGGGLDIFDLSGLPNNVRFVASDSSAFKRAHNLYIADSFAYISGSNVNRGADILDLADPEHPVLVGGWAEEYFHDIFVLGNRLFGSAGSDGKVVVLDIGDKSKPVRIADLPFPDGGYVHNAWATEDGRYLMTTQETTDLTVKMWDITDLQNPAIAGEYLSVPGRLAHNAHIHGDFAYISHYADGLRIVDIADPENLVEVGYYDTSESDGPGFSGNWGAFPFTKSGYVYLSDEDEGLFVVDFNGTHATRLSGRVLDSETGSPIKNATISVAGTGRQARTDSSGSYSLGLVGGGSYTIIASEFYHNASELQLSLNGGEKEVKDWLLSTKPVTELLLTLRNSSGEGIPGVSVALDGTPYDTQVTDGSGQVRVQSAPQGTYQAAFAGWGYHSKEVEFEAGAGTLSSFTFELEPGIEDDFEFDLGWQTETTGISPVGGWQRVRRYDILTGAPFVPSPSETFPDSSYVYYARIFAGKAYLTSRPFQVGGDSSMTVQYNYHWYPQGGNQDSLQVQVSLDGGVSWLQVAAYGDADLTSGWKVGLHTLPVVQPQDEVVLRFVVRENGSELAYALIDNIEVVSQDSDDGDLPPEVFQLSQNYPNPFNHGTTIRFDVVAAGEVRLEIYNLRGERIRSMRQEFSGPGTYDMGWDGTDDGGKIVASGLYLYRLVSANESRSKTMLFLK